MKLSAASLLVLLLCLYCSEASALVRVPIHREPHPLTHLQRLRRLSTGNDRRTNIHLAFNQMFYSYVSFGTPPQTFKATFDPASNISSILSTDCKDCEGLGFHLYDHSKSSTYVLDGRNVSTESFLPFFNDLKGYLSQDTVRIDGLAVNKQIFLEQVYFPSVSIYVEAVIALGYPTVTMENVSGILYTMFREGLVEQPVFGFYFKTPKSVANKTDACGELTLGGSDPEHFVGHLSYVPVDGEALWQFKMDGVKIGEQTFKYCSGGCTAALVTTDPFFVVPDGDKLNLQLGALLLGYSTWLFNCSKFHSGSLPNLTLIINGKGYVLSPDDYAYAVDYVRGDEICLSRIYGPLETGPFKNKWMLGYTFMAKYYTEFDAANKRIGFALAKHH